MCRNILIIEDSPTDAAILVAAFESTGYVGNIHVVTDGLEAIIYLKALQTPEHPDWPNLILLDLNLPIKSGLDVLEEIKSHASWMHTPAVILSSSSSPEDIANSYQRHANAYISKPKQLDHYEAIATGLYNFWFEITQSC